MAFKYTENSSYIGQRDLGQRKGVHGLVSTEIRPRFVIPEPIWPISSDPRLIFVLDPSMIDLHAEVNDSPGYNNAASHGMDTPYDDANWYNGSDDGTVSIEPNDGKRPPHLKFTAGINTSYPTTTGPIFTSVDPVNANDAGVGSGSPKRGYTFWMLWEITGVDFNSAGVDNQNRKDFSFFRYGGRDGMVDYDKGWNDVDGFWQGSLPELEHFMYRPDGGNANSNMQIFSFYHGNDNNASPYRHDYQYGTGGSEPTRREQLNMVQFFMFKVDYPDTSTWTYARYMWDNYIKTDGTAMSGSEWPGTAMIRPTTGAVGGAPGSAGNFVQGQGNKLPSYGGIGTGNMRPSFGFAGVQEQVSGYQQNAAGTTWNLYHAGMAARAYSDAEGYQVVDFLNERYFSGREEWDR